MRLPQIEFLLLKATKYMETEKAQVSQKMRLLKQRKNKYLPRLVSVHVALKADQFYFEKL